MQCLHGKAGCQSPQRRSLIAGRCLPSSRLYTSMRQMHSVRAFHGKAVHRVPDVSGKCYAVTQSPAVITNFRPGTRRSGFARSPPCSRSSPRSSRSPPTAGRAPPDARTPSAPRVRALQVSISSRSCSPWLQSLKSWSLRQSRRGSARYARMNLVGNSTSISQLDSSVAAPHRMPSILGIW